MIISSIIRYRVKSLSMSVPLSIKSDTLPEKQTNIFEKLKISLIFNVWLNGDLESSVFLRWILMDQHHQSNWSNMLGVGGQDHVDHQTSFKQYMNELMRMETRANVSRLQHVCYKYVGDRYWLFENQGYYTGWFIEGYIGTKYKIKISRFYRMWVWKFEYISTPSNWIASEPGFNYGFQCLIKQD